MSASTTRRDEREIARVSAELATLIHPSLGRFFERLVAGLDDPATSTQAIRHIDAHCPLNNAGLLRLLAEADGLDPAEGNRQRLSAVLCRLMDAVPGVTVPLPIEGPVSDRLDELSELYLEAKISGKLLDPAVVARFQELTS
jgi:hypothetical protein